MLAEIRWLQWNSSWYASNYRAANAWGEEYLNEMWLRDSEEDIKRLNRHYRALSCSGYFTQTLIDNITKCAEKISWHKANTTIDFILLDDMGPDDLKTVTACTDMIGDTQIDGED